MSIAMENQKKEEGWYSPQEYQPEINQTLDLVFQGPKDLLRCHATWENRDGVIGFYTLMGYVHPASVVRLRPVSEHDNPAPHRTARQPELTPEERERRSQRMRDYWAKKRRETAETTTTDAYNKLTCDLSSANRGRN
jgi:hypothetical protein